jgi:hypothetical protein
LEDPANSDKTKITDERLVVFARLLKRHTFKENKWKATAASGVAAPWLEKITGIYFSDLTTKIPAKIEVPLSHSSEFFINFEEDFSASAGEIYVERKYFPQLPESEFYLCDVIGERVQTKMGEFKIASYYENADPRGGLTSLTLFLESLEAIKGKIMKVEVPLAVLSRKGERWHVESIDLWLGVQDSSAE